MDEPAYLLEVPRLRIQNANAVSSPLTWGFPAMTAFTGLMYALERKLVERGVDLAFDGVGVICHSHEAQAIRSGRTHGLHLTRNPVDRGGRTAAIVEEGRIHLDLTVVFAVDGDAARSDDAGQTENLVGAAIDEVLPGLRIAGGTIQPPAATAGRMSRARLIAIEEGEEDRWRQAKRLLRSWLPGFGLVLRDDLLLAHAAELRAQAPATDLLDAWLDLSRLNMVSTPEGADSEGAKTRWSRRGPRGWIVPIPVGYAALGPLHDAGTVYGARDESTPVRFVESVYSTGEWKSPHRLDSPADLLWYVVDRQAGDGLYRLGNRYADRAPDPAAN